MTRPKAIVLLSGGLDSTTLAYYLDRAMRYDVDAIAVDYGQRHRRELITAEAIAYDKFQFDVVRLNSFNGLNTIPFGQMLPGTALVDDTVDVPEGHYADESMKATVVPNRNAMMLSIAYAVAIARGAEVVAFAAHAGDHAIYPDCRPEFVEALSSALKLGSAWDNTTPVPSIIAPFIHMSKGEIARIAVHLGVPIADTWSCYKGGEFHCGVCGTCVERREAIRSTDIEDPTRYEVVEL